MNCVADHGGGILRFCTSLFREIAGFAFYANFPLDSSSRELFHLDVDRLTRAVATVGIRLSQAKDLDQ